MPTLEAGSRYDNMQKSVDYDWRTRVATPMNLRTYYMGQSIPQAIVQPIRWATVVFQDFGQIEGLRRASANSLSAWSEASIDVNLYEKSDAMAGGETDIYTLGTLTTNIVQKYEIRTFIPVYDYATVGTPQAGVLRVHDRPKPPTPIDTPGLGIRQMRFSVPIRYYAVIVDD